MRRPPRVVRPGPSPPGRRCPNLCKVRRPRPPKKRTHGVRAPHPGPDRRGRRGRVVQRAVRGLAPPALPAGRTRPWSGSGSTARRPKGGRARHRRRRSPAGPARRLGGLAHHPCGRRPRAHPPDQPARTSLRVALPTPGAAAPWRPWPGTGGCAPHARKYSLPSKLARSSVPHAEPVQVPEHRRCVDERATWRPGCFAIHHAHRRVGGDRSGHRRPPRRRRPRRVRGRP